MIGAPGLCPQTVEEKVYSTLHQSYIEINGVSKTQTDQLNFLSLQDIGLVTNDTKKIWAALGISTA